MSLVDLFDHCTAKPVTLTCVIDNCLQLEKGSARSYHETKLSFGSFSLRLSIERYYSSKDFVITLNVRENIPEFYYRISVIDKDGQKWKSTRIDFGSGDSFKYFIYRPYLLDKKYGLLPDGKLTICCEIFEFTNNPGIKRCLNNLVSLSQNNQSLLDSGKLSDVVLVVDEREFKAHKVILSARSVVFEKMFEHDLEESKRNRVEIEDMSAAAVEDLLKFIYTGKVGHLEQHVHELYAAADKYQIDSLKSYCALYLEMSISASTFSKTLQLAELYSLEDLKSKCIHYIGHHSAEFGFDAWKEFAASRPELMYQLFVGSKAK